MKSTEKSLLEIQNNKEQNKNKDKIILSKRDQEIFFEAICNPPKPNNDLRKAADRYNLIVAKENGMV